MACLLRCRACRRGFTTWAAPAFRCAVCAGGQWVPVTRLTLTDRLRLWWQTGVAPWTTASPWPE